MPSIFTSKKGHVPWGAAGGQRGPHSRSNIVPHCSMHISRHRVLSTGTSPSFTECPKLGCYAHLSTCWKPGSPCMNKRVSYHVNSQSQRESMDFSTSISKDTRFLILVHSTPCSSLPGINEKQVQVLSLEQRDFWSMRRLIAKRNGNCISNLPVYDICNIYLKYIYISRKGLFVIIISG